ncbi:MAG: hypothetical protein EXR88_03635 [Gammaproteobacteria bacterium]|nr:hypothetical protein [Gammaproteobacteria bacterium]
MTLNFRPNLMIIATLAVLMCVTRLGHFGEYAGVPDASWAVFFLGGLWLRDPRVFAAFFALGWLVDVVAVSLGTPADCFSLAYVALIPAYGALWLAGTVGATRLGASYLDTALRTAVLLISGCSTTFVLANLGMFWFAPSTTDITLLDFAYKVGGYFPGYLLTCGIYVVGGLVARNLLDMLNTRLSTQIR